MARETLSEIVFDAIGANASLCTQCVKCTSGCPLADNFDLTPNQVMRSVELDDSRVLESRAIWLCASCHTCATRCPQEIDVTGVMDVLRIEARRRGLVAVPEIAAFDSLFVRCVKMLGRNYELGFAAAYNASLGRPLRDAGLAARMLRRGKLKPLPTIARGANGKSKAAPSNAVAYFPGCSMDSSAIEYGRSAQAVAEALGIELVEPDGWACCGSSAAHRLDPALATALPMRTIAAVEAMGLDTLTSPCSMCFSRLKAAVHATRRDTVAVRHLLEVIVSRAGLAAVKERVRTPLTDLSVACYYGCLITRPPRFTGAEDAEYPVTMDRLVEALGARAVDWSHKTECCGGSLSVTQTPLALKLSRKVIESAVASGAEAVVTMCPMCHLNLDARQREMGLDKDIPIVHATQLMALAFGLGAKASLDRNLVDPRPLLRRKGLRV